MYGWFTSTDCCWYIYTSKISECMVPATGWMTSNKLQRNPDKTEVLRCTVQLVDVTSIITNLYTRGRPKPVYHFRPKPKLRWSITETRTETDARFRPKPKPKLYSQTLANVKNDLIMRSLNSGRKYGQFDKPLCTYAHLNVWMFISQNSCRNEN